MSKRIKLIFILGGPGAGKSTVSNIIQDLIPKSTSLKSGQVVRNSLLQEDRINHEEKTEVNHIMQQGGLVSDQVVTLLISKEILNVNVAHSIDCFIMDGFPRTTNQLRLLMDKGTFVIGGTFFLSAPHAIMEKRCKMRNLRTDRIDDCKGPVEARLNDYNHHLKGIKEDLKVRKVPIFELDTCESMEKMKLTIEDFLKKLK